MYWYKLLYLYLVFSEWACTSCSVFVSVLIPQCQAAILSPYNITKWPISVRTLWVKEMLRDSFKQQIVTEMWFSFGYCLLYFGGIISKKTREEWNRCKRGILWTLRRHCWLITLSWKTIPKVYSHSGDFICFVLLIDIGYQNQYGNKRESLELSARVWRLHISEVSESRYSIQRKHYVLFQNFLNLLLTRMPLSL